MLQPRDSAGLPPSGNRLSIFHVFLFGLAVMAFGVEPSAAYPASWPQPPPRPHDLQAMLEVPPPPPLPPIRPQDLQPQKQPVSKAAGPKNGMMGPFMLPDRTGDTEAMRAQLLASGKIVGESLPEMPGPTPVNSSSTNIAGCGIEAPVRLVAIVLQDGNKVTLASPLVMRASLAGSIADWVRDDLVPAIASKGDRLAQITGVGAYQCRSRDHIAGAKLSEHAIGNAMDMEAFVTAKGTHFAVAQGHGDVPEDRRSFLAQMKKTACRRFMTVLGPGADSYHALHLHVDLEARRSGSHLCEWDLPPETADSAASSKP